MRVRAPMFATVQVQNIYMLLIMVLCMHFFFFFFGISNFKNATTMYFYFQTKSSIMHVSVILHSPMSYTRDNALVTYTKKGERPIAQILQSLSRIFILLMRI